MALLAAFLDSLSAPARILDAGCGQGIPVLRRLSAASAAVGLDLSRGQLRVAAERVPAAALLRADLTALPFREGAFDAAVAYHSIIHVPEGDHRSVVEEFARVLSPGGRLLLTEGRDPWSGTNPDWLDGGAEMQWSIVGAEATRTHLRDAGFTVVAEHDVTDEADDERWVFFSARLDG